MPIYDFVCEKCETRFERILSTYSSTEVQVCPNCASEETSIQFPSPYVVKSGVIGARAKIPTDFKQGVLEPMKKFYGKTNPNINDVIKT